MSYSLLNSTTWHIKQDGTGNFTTIQEGINASVHSDTVLVYPGRYYENVNYNGKNITVASLELITGDETYITTTIIDGNQQGSCVIIANEEVNAILRGFTITNGSGSIMYGDIHRLGGGVLIFTPYPNSPPSVNIINCRIHNNSAVSGGGIKIQKASVGLSGVSVFNNQAIAGGGINILYESTVTFDPANLCSIYNNFAGSIMDIFVSDAVNDVEVIVDTFTVFDDFDYYARYNHQIANTGELTFNIQNNFIERINQNLYVSCEGEDTNNGLTPETPLKTIALALQKIESDSLNPKTVYVSSGTYSRELNDQIFPLGGKKNINLTGENMDNTILLNDYCEKTYGMGEGKGHCNLQNFTFISSGQLMLDVIGISSCDNIKLSNLLVEGNYISSHYSVDLYRCYGVAIDNLNVVNNLSEVASGFSLDGGNAVIKNSVFDNNDSIGPNQFVSNFYCQVDDYLELENCVFSNSDIPPFQYEEYSTVNISAQQDCFPDIKVSNCLFTNNSTTNGSYVVRISSPGSVEVNNCTFTQNTSHICPLGIFGEIDFRNNILYNNESDYEYEINTGNYPTIPSILNVEYCDIEGGESAIYPGNPPNQATINWLEGNINEDPLFLLSGNDPYQLTELSPCIDTGTQDTTGFFLPPWDLLHNYRVWDGDENGIAIIDMGCYEFGADPVRVSDDPIPVTEYQLTNYPNPFNPETKIVFDLPESGQVKLEIYNIKGQKVKTLLDCYMNPGRSEMLWNSKDDDGKRVSSGVYFYKLSVNGKTEETKKMLLLK
ncbi:MAG: T9SS type A sorting domain-containing protein [Candidatus Heimdallarchaeota archaeon]|nr:T9SS type A sorting domain-containing protein [Candidatus Heimdallarchaeota archaeon]